MDVHWLCNDCGEMLLSLEINKGKKQYALSTWHPDVCDLCGKKKIVTERRDFGYPTIPNYIKRRFNL